MVNAAGKFGPYNQAGPFPALPGAGALMGAATGADLVRSRIALHVRLAVLRPGDRLPDTGHLAEQLGIGEMTVRRALEGLCQDGLLDRRRGRTGGTFVSADWDTVVPACHDAAEAAAVAAFLLLLECGLVAHACGEVTPEALKGVRDLGPVSELASDQPGSSGAVDRKAEGRPRTGCTWPGPTTQRGSPCLRREVPPVPDDPGPAGVLKQAPVVRTPEQAADPVTLLELETRFHLELAAALGGPSVREVVADLLGRLILLQPAPDAQVLLRRDACHGELMLHLAAGRTEPAVAAVKRSWT